jgi:hypothetical protein
VLLIALADPAGVVGWFDITKLAGEAPPRWHWCHQGDARADHSLGYHSMVCFGCVMRIVVHWDWLAHDDQMMAWSLH